MDHVVSFANVVMGLILAFYSFRRYWYKRGKATAWMDLGYFLIGLYFAGLYVFVLLVPIIGIQVDSVGFGRTFVRAPITILLSLAASKAIVGSKAKI